MKPTDLILIIVSYFVHTYFLIKVKHLSANPTEWPNTLKQFVGNLPRNSLSVFDHYVKLTLKGIIFKTPRLL